MHRRLVAVFAIIITTTPFLGCANQLEDDPAFTIYPSRKDAGAADSRKDSGSVDTGSPDTEEPTDTGSEDTGVEDTGVEDTRVADTGSVDTGDPCNDCVNAACKGELAACTGDAACSAQMKCLAMCTDAICADKCAADFPSTKVDTLLTCVSTKCATACGGP